MNWQWAQVWQASCSAESITVCQLTHHNLQTPHTTWPIVYSLLQHSTIWLLLGQGNCAKTQKHKAPWKELRQSCTFQISRAQWHICAQTWAHDLVDANVVQCIQPHHKKLPKLAAKDFQEHFLRDITLLTLNVSASTLRETTFLHWWVPAHAEGHTMLCVRPTFALPKSQWQKWNKTWALGFRLVLTREQCWCKRETGK